MNQSTNHWLALYLSGKYPGHLRTPDKLLFIEELQALDPQIFSDDKIKMFGMFGEVNEYEFYLGFLNKVERNSEKGKISKTFHEFIETLGIPSEIRGECYKSSFARAALLKDFNDVKADNSTTKWTAFENFLKRFFGSMNWLEVVNIKQASDEQIDIILKNNVDRPFWLQLWSSLLIGEAKNWTRPTPTEVFNTLRGKMDGHKNFSHVWMVIAMDRFTEVVDNNLMRDWSGDKILFPITWEDIANLLQSEEDPIDWLESKMTQAFK